MVSVIDSYYLQRSVDLCGSCKYSKLFALLVWLIHIFVSIILFILYNIPRNICLEILINLWIYLVFIRISNCILWNPWISVVNLQYFNLKSFKKLSFYNSVLSPLHLFHCRIKVVRGVSLLNCQFRSILNLY